VLQSIAPLHSSHRCAHQQQSQDRPALPACQNVTFRQGSQHCMQHNGSTHGRQMCQITLKVQSLSSCWQARFFMTEQHCSRCKAIHHIATVCKSYLGERALKQLLQLVARLMIIPMSDRLYVDDLYIINGAGNVCAGCLCTHKVCEKHAVWQCLRVAHCCCRGAGFGSCPLTLLVLLGELLLSPLLLLLDLLFLFSDSCLGSFLLFLCQ